MGSGSRGRRYSFEEEKGLVWAYFHVIQEKPHLPARDSNTNFWNCVYETWGEKFPQSKQYVKTASLQFHFRAMRLMASELAFLYDVAIRTGIVPPRSPEAVSVVVQIYSRIFYRKPGRSFVRPQYWELLRMEDNWAELRGGVITRQLHFSLRELEIAQSLTQSESGEYSSQMQLVSSALCEAILPKVRESRTRKQLKDKVSPDDDMDEALDLPGDSPRRPSVPSSQPSPKPEKPDARETSDYMRRKYARDHNRYWQPYYYDYEPMPPPSVVPLYPTAHPAAASVHAPGRASAYPPRYSGPSSPSRPALPPVSSPPTRPYPVPLTAADQARPPHPASAYGPPPPVPRAAPYPPPPPTQSYPVPPPRPVHSQVPREYPPGRSSANREPPMMMHARDHSGPMEPVMRSSASTSTPETLPSDAVSFSTEATDLATDVEPQWHPSSVYASPGAWDQRPSYPSWDHWGPDYDAYYHANRRPTLPSSTYSPYARPRHWRSPQADRPSAEWSPASKNRPSTPVSGWRPPSWTSGYAPQWNPYT